MSENKNIPEIIYIDKIHFNDGCTPMFKAWNTKRFSYHEIEYILKSKYDELLKEKEELEKKLQIITDSDIKEVLKKRR